MGRKKAAEAGQSGGHEGEKPADKASAVRQALGTGLTSPTEVASYVLKKFGMEVTTNYVSVIKSQAKQSGSSLSKKPASPKPAPAKTVSSLGLAPQDLAELADLVEKAGGVDRLEEYLEVIKRMK